MRALYDFIHEVREIAARKAAPREYRDSDLSEYHNSIFDNIGKHVVAHKNGDIVAMVHNTTGRDITYHVTGKDENGQPVRKPRVLKHGYSAKVHTTNGGELNLQVDQHGHPGAHHYADLHVKANDPIGAKALAHYTGKKVITTEDMIEKALQGIDNEEDRNALRASLSYHPEKSTVKMVRAPHDMVIHKPGWGPGAKQTVRKGDMLQMTSTGEVFGNSVPKWVTETGPDGKKIKKNKGGTLDQFVDSYGQPISKMLHRVPYAKKAALQAAHIPGTGPEPKAAPASPKGKLHVKKKRRKDGVVQRYRVRD